MGIGRNTQAFANAHSSDLTSYGLQARKLRKDHLGGVIFGCKNVTMMECLSKQIFGLPGPHYAYVKNINPGLPLFLFNYSDRTLHGIYEAASHSQMNIDPYGWTVDGSMKTQFPAQVQIRVRMQCQALPESQFKPIIADNYYSFNKFWFELDHTQANNLMSALSSSVIAPNISMPPNNSKRPADLPLQYKRKTTEGAQWFKPLTSGDTTLVENHISDVKESENDEQHVVCTKLKELSLQNNLNSQFQDVPLSINSNDTFVFKATWPEVGGNPTEPVRSNIGDMKITSEKNGESTCSLSALSPHSSPDQSRIDKVVQEVEELKTFKNEQSRKMGDLEYQLEQAKLEIKQLKEAMKLECESTPSLAHIDENQIQSEIPSILTTEEKATSCDMLNLDPNESIYLVGGYDGESWLSSVDSYYPSRNVMQSLEPMSSVRAYTSAARLNGDIYVIGGGNSAVWYNTVESYCIAEDKWKICPSLREKKGSLAAATANNKIYVMGGGNGVDCFSDVEMLDIDVGRWISTQSMPQKRFSLAAAELNGAIYATGGYDGKGYLKSVDRFDPREHIWKTSASMNSKRGCHSLVGLNGKLYALGGYDGDSMVSTVEIFDPRLETWMPGEPMNYARGYSAAAVINDAIYVIGGVQQNAIVAETVECYREGQGWQKMNGATSKRCFLSAVAYTT